MGPYAISVVNDSITQQLHEAVGKLLARHGFDDPTSLRNELLCGERGMESVEPVKSALDLTARVRADVSLTALFASDARDADVWRAIESDARFAPFRAAARRHLDAYGDRTLHELKLETPSARENPAFVVTMIRTTCAPDATSRRWRRARRRSARAPRRWWTRSSRVVR